jgi:hypothetical protein
VLASARVVVSVDVAKAAGVALARMPRVDAALTIDAIVMATAALLGAIVLTSDVSDLERLGTAFPAVAVLGI